MEDKKIEQKGKEYWLDHPSNISIIVWILVAVCVLLFFSDAFYHKHSYFEIENMFGFYGVYGFFVCVALVLLAKLMRSVLMRPENYYEASEQTRRGTDLSDQAHD